MHGEPTTGDRPTPATAAPHTTLSPADLDRLAAFGLQIDDGAAGSATDEPLWAVTGRGAPPADSRHPVSFQFVPAVAPPRPGPVAVLSPAGRHTVLELYLGAALAVGTGRRVVHLNARGTQASMHSSAPSRAAVRAAVRDWTERAESRPERALHTLDSRPAVIVVVADDPATVADLVAAHPDADVVLIHDRITGAHGAAVAEQFGAMVELTLAMGSAAAAPPPSPTTRAARPRPAFRASDVVHVRLTDSRVEVTNRTGRAVRVRLGLGAREEPPTVRQYWEAAVPAGELVVGELDDTAASALSGLARPQPILRHWSHGSSVVFEGGELRVNRIELAAAADGATTLREFRVGNGLDFSLTARELQALDAAAPAVEVLPEPVAPTAPDFRGSLLAAVTDAVRAAGGLLSSVRRAPGS